MGLHWQRVLRLHHAHHHRVRGPGGRWANTTCMTQHTTCYYFYLPTFHVPTFHVLTFHVITNFYMLTTVLSTCLLPSSCLLLSTFCLHHVFVCTFLRACTISDKFTALHAFTLSACLLCHCIASFARMSSMLLYCILCAHVFDFLAWNSFYVRTPSMFLDSLLWAHVLYVLG